MKTETEYYQEIIDNKMDFEYINFILNQALRDLISSKDYQYLCTVAKSFGFGFGVNFVLL